MKQDSQRLVLFIFLSIGILASWGYLFPPPKQSKKKRKTALVKSNKINKSSKTKARTTANKTNPTFRKAAGPSSQPSSRPTSRTAKLHAAKGKQVKPVVRTKPKSRLPKASSKSLTYKSKLASATVRAQGGSLVHWKLSAFRDMSNKKSKKSKEHLDMITKMLRKSPPYTERLLDKRLVPHDEIPYSHVSKPKPNILKFVGHIPSSKGGYVEIEKRYIFNSKSYQFHIEFKLTNKTTHDIRSQMAVRLQFSEDPKKLKAGGMFSSPPEQLRILCRTQDKEKPEQLDYLKMQKKAKKMLKKELSGSKKLSGNQISIRHKKFLSGNVAYMGIDRRYFVMALIPQWNKGDRGMGCAVSAGLFGHVKAEIQNTGLSISPGNSQVMKYSAYFGPKYYSNLKTAGAKLQTSIDFGIFAFLCKPMLWTMQFLYDMLKKVNIHNWGIAIIILTLLIKLVTWPLTQKSMQSMKSMQRLKPEMERLKEKYGDDKESIQRETMALYVKYGINPISGCLPMVLQMPIWIALYQTILHSVELYQAPFIPGWIDDLSGKDPFYVLPVMLGLAMLVQHKLTPQTLDNAQAKIMGMVMPIFFTAIMLFLPAGLTLYIFVNTVLGVAHQWHVYQQPDKEEPAKKAPTKKGWMQRMQQYAEEQQNQKK